MDIFGIVFFNNGDSEEIIFYDDSREHLVEFKTRTDEYVMDKKTREFYRRILSETIYGDRVYDYIQANYIDRLYLIEKELFI